MGMEMQEGSLHAAGLNRASSLVNRVSASVLIGLKRCRHLKGLFFDGVWEEPQSIPACDPCCEHRSEHCSSTQLHCTSVSVQHCRLRHSRLCQYQYPVLVSGVCPCHMCHCARAGQGYNRSHQLWDVYLFSG